MVAYVQDDAKLLKMLDFEIKGDEARALVGVSLLPADAATTVQKKIIVDHIINYAKVVNCKAQVCC